MKPKFKAGDLITNAVLSHKSILFILGYQETDHLYYDYPHYKYYELKHPESICSIERSVLDRCFIKVNV